VKPLFVFPFFDLRREISFFQIFPWFLVYFFFSCLPFALAFSMGLPLLFVGNRVPLCDGVGADVLLRSPFVGYFLLSLSIAFS